MIIAVKLYLALLINSENSRHRLGLGFFFLLNIITDKSFQCDRNFSDLLELIGSIINK